MGGGGLVILQLFQLQIQTLNLISSFHIHFNIIFINGLWFNVHLISLCLLLPSFVTDGLSSMKTLLINLPICHWWKSSSITQLHSPFDINDKGWTSEPSKYWKDPKRVSCLNILPLVRRLITPPEMMIFHISHTLIDCPPYLIYCSDWSICESIMWNPLWV